MTGGVIGEMYGLVPWTIYTVWGGQNIKPSILTWGKKRRLTANADVITETEKMLRDFLLGMIMSYPLLGILRRYLLHIPAIPFLIS